MSTFSGADVEHLLALASKIEFQSRKFDEIASSSTQALMVAAWTGANIDRVRDEWNRQSKPTIVRVSQTLAQMSIELRKHAEQQRVASGIGGSNSQGNRDGRNQEWDLWVERLSVTLANTLSAVDIGKLAVWLGSGTEYPLLDQVLGPISIGMEGSVAHERIVNGDYAAAFTNVLSGGAAVANWGAAIGVIGGWGARLNPLGLGLSALAGLVDVAMPVSDDEQDATLAMGARHMYGPGVDMSNLTSEQADSLAGRYGGVWGCLVMVSDTMDATAESVFPWNRGHQ